MLQKVTDDDVRNALDRQFLHHDDVENVAQSALSTDDVEFHDDVEIHHDDVGNVIPATFPTDAVEKHPCCRKCKFLHSAHSDDVENSMDDVEKRYSTDDVENDYVWSFTSPHVIFYIMDDVKI